MKHLDHPMLPFDSGRHVVNQWAFGDGFYTFADWNFQAFSDEHYAVMMRRGLPTPMAAGPLKDVCDKIHAALCKFRKLPDGLVNGVPEWN